MSPWYLDIKETWVDSFGNTREHSFSIPILQVPSSQIAEISLQEFVDLVNGAFETASEPVNWTSPEPSPGEPETWIRYKLLTHGRLATGISTSEESSYNTQFSFAIRYNIKGDPDFIADPPGSWGSLQNFQIQFRDGMHGPNQQISQAIGPRPSAQVSISNHTDTRAVILPYSTHIATILDKPPLPPVSEIVPFVGVSNKILLLLNSSTGEYLGRPVVILDSDAAAIAEQYVGQTGNPIDVGEVRSEIDNPVSPLRIQFKNDDPISKFQVFRITSKPESYADFNVLNNPHAVVAGDVTVEKKASSAFLLDDIEPNTKYYYCFRALDVHNNFSNPTHVYEVEMVDNDGQVYLILNTVIFNNEPQAVKKAARRYVYIEPSMRNLQIPEATLPSPVSVVGDNPNPGAPIFQATDQGESCWNKTFKVRLTSKKSGKKIDLNILFKNTGVVNP